jgi:serine/threonine-protein kinase
MSATCLIGSRYRLVDRLGAGGMATVYRAYDQQSGQHVAVKLMASHLAADELAVRRFKREVRICTQLRHPNIVAGLGGGYDEQSERHYIVMELVDGDDAATLADQPGRLAVSDVIGMVAQIADALNHAHRQGIVHGDVSPANILVRRTDRVAKLTDFGLARPRWTQPDVPGRVIGTPRYLAPEVACGGAATPLSDLFSLASVAHRLITLESPRLDGPDVPLLAARAIEKALATDPGERHATACQFGDALTTTRLVSVA